MTESVSNPQSRQLCLSLIGESSKRVVVRTTDMMQSMQRSSQNKASRTTAFQLTSSLATEDSLLSIHLLLAMQANSFKPTPQACE